MSSRRKKILIGIGAIFGAGAIGIGAILFHFTRPSVQSEYARKFFREHGIHADSPDDAFLKITPRGDIFLKNLTILTPECSFFFAETIAKIEVLPFIFEKKINLETLKISGVEIDRTQKNPSETAGKPTADELKNDTAGTNPPVIIASAEISGKLKTNDTGNFSFQLRGRRINTDFGGEIFFNALEENGEKRTLEGTALLAFAEALNFSETVSFENLRARKMTLSAQAKITNSAGKMLTLNAGNLPDANSGQAWKLRVATGTGEGIPHINGAGKISENGVVSGKINFDFLENPLALLPLKIPFLTPPAKGEITFSGSEKSPVSFTISTGANIDDLASQPAWKDALQKFTGQNWNANLQAAGILSENILTVKTASLAAKKNDTGVIPLTADLLAPLTFDDGFSLRDFRASLTAKNFSLELATPFLAGAKASGVIDGSVEISCDKTGVTIAANTGKISLQSVSFTAASNDAWFENFSLTARAKLFFEKNTGDMISGWTLEIFDGKTGEKNDTALAGNFSMRWASELKDATFDLSGDPASLLHQPILGGLKNLTSAHAKLTGFYRPDAGCDLALSLKNIQGKAGIGEIKSFTANAAGTFLNGQKTLTASAKLDGDAVSDFTIFAEQTPPGEWQVSLDAEVLDLPDFMRLAAILTPPENDTAQKNDTAAIADSEPFWGDWRGGLRAKIKRVETPEMTFQNVTADTKLSAEKLRLDSISANAVGGIFRAEGDLDFLKNRAENPYDLRIKASAAEVPFRNCISLLHPASANIIEGRFNAVCEANSTAKTISGISEKLSVSFDFKSANGHVKIFQMDNALMNRAGEIGIVVSGVGDIVGGLFSSQKMAPVADKIRAFETLQKYLADFPYENAEIRVRRDNTGSVKVENFSLANDQMRINGTGEIALRDDVNFADSPMSLSANLAAKNALADALRGLRLVQNENDTDGFFAGPNFTLSGTLNEAQSNLLSTLFGALQGIITQSGLNMNDGKMAPAGNRGIEKAQEKIEQGVNQMLDRGTGILREFGF